MNTAKVFVCFFALLLSGCASYEPGPNKTVYMEGRSDCKATGGFDKYSWTGSCVGEKMEGYGEFSMYKDNEKLITYTGEMKNGAREGRGIYVYHIYFPNDMPSWRKVYDGMYLTGEWRKGNVYNGAEYYADGQMRRKFINGNETFVGNDMDRWYGRAGGASSDGFNRALGEIVAAVGSQRILSSTGNAQAASQYAESVRTLMNGASPSSQGATSYSTNTNISSPGGQDSVLGGAYKNSSCQKDSKATYLLKYDFEVNIYRANNRSMPTGMYGGTLCASIERFNPVPGDKKIVAYRIVGSPAIIQNSSIRPLPANFVNQLDKVYSTGAYSSQSSSDTFEDISLSMHSADVNITNASSKCTYCGLCEFTLYGLGKSPVPRSAMAACQSKDFMSAGKYDQKMAPYNYKLTLRSVE